MMELRGWNFLGGGGGKPFPTVVVAASDALSTSGADYICDGVDDETEINGAITDLAVTGGRIGLTEGTYILGGSIVVSSNITIEGNGTGTILKLEDNHNIDIDLITNSEHVSGNENIRIGSLKIDGNKANQTGGVQNGIGLYKVTDTQMVSLVIRNCLTDGIYIADVLGNDTYRDKVIQCLLSENGANGIHYYGTDLQTVALCDFYANGAHGIQGDYGPNISTILGSLFDTNTQCGGYFNGCRATTFQGNVFNYNLEDGLFLDGNGSQNAVNGNTFNANTRNGIQINSRNMYASIVGNTIDYNIENGIYVYRSSTYAGSILISSNNICRNQKHGIYINLGSWGSIIANLFRDNSYAGSNTYDHIRIEGDSNQWAIMSNHFRSQAKYCVNLTEAAVDDTLVIGNDMKSGYVTAAINNAGTNTITSRTEWDNRT